MKNQKGITLISLIVVIIVIFILMGISMQAIVGDNSLINKSRDSSISQRFAIYYDELNASKMNSDIGDVLSEYDKNYENTEKIIGIISEYTEMKKFIPSLREDDAKYIRIVGGELALVGNDVNVIDIAENTETDLYSTDDELDYKYEMYLVEQYIKNKNSIGYEMPGLENMSQEIAGKKYSDGWNYVTKEDISSDGFLKGVELKHAPYIVKLGKNYVQSIDGDDYKGIWTYTFNYNGDDDIVLSSMLTAIDDTSTRSSDAWGSFKFHKDTLHNFILNPTYNNDTGSLQLKEVERTENGETITECTKIPYLDVDQRLSLNEKYSICITVKGSIYYDGHDPRNESNILPNALVALSDKGGKYVAWIGFYNGYIYVYSFQSFLSYAQIENGEYENGFSRIKLDDSLNNEYMNIQYTAERGGKTKLYINGELITTFDSGEEYYTYDILTIGDLRKNRGIRYDGEIYNFALYGKILSEDEIRHNWEYTKNKLGL